MNPPPASLERHSPQQRLRVTRGSPGISKIHVYNSQRPNHQVTELLPVRLQGTYSGRPSHVKCDATSKIDISQTKQLINRGHLPQTRVSEGMKPRMVVDIQFGDCHVHSELMHKTAISYGSDGLEGPYTYP